jgi:hypothetical protein
MSAFRYIPLVAVLALAACGGPQVTMRNAEGDQVACKAGDALPSSSTAEVKDGLLTECVDHYRLQGYEIASIKKG